jgi:viologen exporter family transport system permease protein
LQSWRAARVTPVTELGRAAHIVPSLAMLIIQLLLTFWLWQALYSGVRVSAGMNVGQATTYALLGVLYIQFRQVDRGVNGDTMPQLMFDGTIAYWFLRPVPPQRYYLIRAVGDLAYGGAWVVAGYFACRATGAIDGPASPAAGWVALCTMAFGLVILYYLQLCLDLICFWSVVNQSAVTALQFVQFLLSGALAPLWFFPAWFQHIAAALPFQSTLNVPLSLYVGRLPISSFGPQIALQAAWCVALAVGTRWLWRRAAARVTVLGG